MTNTNTTTTNETTYTQAEILNLINQYDIKNPDTRKTIKQNYIRILKKYDIQPKDIMKLGYARNNTYSWSTKVAPNVPMLDQALTIACAFGFDVQEFLFDYDNLKGGFL